MQRVIEVMEIGLSVIQNQSDEMSNNNKQLRALNQELNEIIENLNKEITELKSKTNGKARQN